MDRESLEHGAARLVGDRDRLGAADPIGLSSETLRF
jgi:hypothetical protein